MSRGYDEVVARAGTLTKNSHRCPRRHRSARHPLTTGRSVAAAGGNRALPVADEQQAACRPRAEHANVARLHESGVAPRLQDAKAPGRPLSSLGPGNPTSFEFSTRTLRSSNQPAFSSRRSPLFQPGLPSFLLVAASYWPTSAPRVACHFFLLGATTLRAIPAGRIRATSTLWICSRHAVVVVVVNTSVTPHNLSLPVQAKSLSILFTPALLNPWTIPTPIPPCLASSRGYQSQTPTYNSFMTSLLLPPEWTWPPY